MSPGTRRLYRTTSTFSSSGLISSFPKEPLLFLYPPWLRTTASGARAAHVLSGRAAVSVSQDREVQTAKLSVQGQAHLRPRSSDHTSDVASVETKETTSSRHSPPQSAVNDDDELNPFVKAEQRAFAQQRYLRKIRHNLVVAQARKDYEHRVTDSYQERRRNERNGSIPNWRRILQELEFYTPQLYSDQHRHALTIQLPKVALKDLLFGLNDDIWDVQRRTGCRISVLAGNAAENHRVILLSGNVTSISNAAKDVLRLAPGAVIDKSKLNHNAMTFDTRPSSHTEPGRQKITRHVRAEQRRYLTRPRRVDSIEKPSQWTSASFGRYIYSLTNMKMSSHLKKLIYRPNEVHVNMVMDLLMQAFFNPEAKHAISITAFNDALSYAMRVDQVKLARQLFVRMEMLNLPVNTETFNIMLRGCAKSNDLGTFHFLLHMMFNRGHSPDAHTWLALIRAVRNREIKQYVLDRMKVKQIFQQPGIQKEVCEQFVTEDIQQSLAKAETLDEFVKYMSGRYSEDWLTLGSASRILYVLSNVGLLSRCLEFLHLMQSRRIVPNAFCYNSILSPCRRLENVDGAFEILFRGALLQANPRFDSTTYSILFDLAWKSRLYNVTRVLWRYACLDTCTTFRMRGLINKAIKNATRKAEHSSDEEFTTADEWYDKVSRFTKTLPSAVQPVNKVAPFVRTMRDQVEQVKYWIPDRPLLEVLQHAFAVDKEYQVRRATQKYEKHELLAWFHEKSVTIPVSPRIARNSGANVKKSDW